MATSQMYGYIWFRSRIAGKRKRPSTWGRFTGAGSDVVPAPLRGLGVSGSKLFDHLEIKAREM